MGPRQDQRQGQQGKDGPVDGVSAHHQGQGVLQGAAPQGGEPEQDVQPRQQGGPVPAEAEDQHQDDAVVVVVKAAKGQCQHAQHKEPPPAGGQPPHGQQTEQQGEKDVPVGQVAQDVIGVEGQYPEGLGHHRKNGQATQVALDAVGVEQAHRHAVAEQREGQAADPAEPGRRREKGAADVVRQHGGDGDELEQVGVQVGAQPGLRGLCGLLVHVHFLRYAIWFGVRGSP